MIRAVVGVLEAVDGLRIHNFGRKIYTLRPIYEISRAVDSFSARVKYFLDCIELGAYIE